MSILRRSMIKLSSFLVNTVAWLLIITVYGPFLLLLTFWRYFVNFIAVKLYADLTPCSPNDTLLVYETPDKQPILTGGFVLKVQGHIDTVKLSTLFEELFLSQEHCENYLNLYCDLVKFCGYLFKRKIVSKIKLCDNHFQSKVLKKGEDFKPVLASWFQEKFQKGVPLWQILVINEDSDVEIDVAKDGQISYFAFKAHHVLMDGYSFVHLLDKLTGVTSPSEWIDSISDSPLIINNNMNNDKTLHEIEDDCVKSLNEKRNTFWEELKILFSVPEVVASFTLPNISLNSANSFPESKPLSRFEMLPMSCSTVSLGAVKDIRRKLGVHFPAIVYGLQAGVIREALLDSCSGQPFETKDIPECILISTSLPVVGLEHPRNKFTNHWSGGYVKVPLRISSAKERIRMANSSLEKILANDGTYITWKYLAYLMWLFPCWFHSILEKCQFLKLCKYRSSMSCIPQSCTVQYNLMGLPVQNIYHAPVMKDSFINAVLLGCSSSHHDQVDFSLFGHPDWFPDQERMDKVMESYLRKELELLANECDVSIDNLNWRC